MPNFMGGDHGWEYMIGGERRAARKLSELWRASETYAFLEEADPRGFARETREVLRVLAFRMMRENDELYPLVEAVETEAPRSVIRSR